MGVLARRRPSRRRSAEEGRLAGISGAAGPPRSARSSARSADACAVLVRALVHPGDTR